MSPVEFSKPRQTSFWNLFFEPVDNSPLVLFRGVFGLLIALEAGGAIATGWVRRVFVEPTFTFNFIGFDWLQPLVGETMYILYATMAALGLMVMLGYHYRFAVVSFGLLWTVSYLLQKTSYNNHYYLLILLCGMMAIVPAHRYWSLDVKQGRVAQSLTCPRWCLLIFGLQVGIVYFFAAVAKLYPGWLSGEPIGAWLANKADYFLIGPWLQSAWLPMVVAYGGVTFDALVVPLLLWRRTRLFAFGVGLVFHLFNSAVFHIGIFPYLMIGICVFYFPPEQIRRWFFGSKPSRGSVAITPYPTQRWLVALFAIYFAWQIYLPLRHHLYYGDVLWTEEGHRMAWRMMLRSRWGNVTFTVVDPTTGKSWNAVPSDYLTPKQARKLAANPDLIWQFSQRLEEDYRRKGYADVEVYATARASVNGSKLMPLTDPTVDLTQVNWTPFRHATWIVSHPENKAY
ncbi:MAG: HTTM domain-containing protein [Tunicatimonas sp.]